MSKPQLPPAKPILLIDVSRTLRAHGGKIWHVTKGEEGTTFRATIHSMNVRVLVPFGQQVTDAPFEKGSPGHVVRSIPALEAWLDSFDEGKLLPFGPTPIQS